MKPESIRERWLPALLVASMIFAAAATSAQSPAQPYASPYPPPQQMPASPPPPPVSPVRNAFAATLSAVLRESVAAGTMGVSSLLTGAITGWFDRKNRQLAQGYTQAPQPGAQAPAYGTPYTPSPYQAPASAPAASTAAPYPANPGTDPYAATTGTTPSAAYPGQAPPAQQPYPSSYPSESSGPAQSQPYASSQPYPSSPSYSSPAPAYDGSVQYYDPQTGQPVAPAGLPANTAAADDALYAGIAYEVHALGANGSSIPVNAATHEFRSGDRFMVHFRPSLPGRIEVYNINPYGQQTRIDAANMAAGQLTSLGPYEFAGATGDEALRLVLTPCSTPQLLTATRDIVNVSGAATQPGVALSSCNTIGTRSVKQIRTRDIKKVAVDGATSFALDPVAQSEISSGQWAPREVTITFRHRG
jgi:hypothetical protein